MNHSRKKAWFRFLKVAALAATAAVFPLMTSAAPDRNLLTGTVKATAGERMSGATVSARAEGSTITTSVFTDEEGAFYFPALTAGQYDVWAQADGYETARGNVNLATETKHQDFVLKPMQDFERQLTGDQIPASLPDQTPDDKRLKLIFRNTCTSCHQPNYILQNKFDEQGWTAIMDAMKHFNVAGGYLGPDSKPMAAIEFHEKELATYLAGARGLEPTSMKFKLRPRPSGDAARVVFTEYDVPLFGPNDGPKKYATNNGSDWSLGTPSAMFGQHGVHDAQADLNGNIWFSVNVPNPYASLGRVDAKTGEVKFFRVDGLHGLAANGHGASRDAQGHLWFNIAPGEEKGPGRLVEVDPAAQTLQVYTPPNTMEGPTFIAGTVDVDGKGKIWASTFHGASRFDPVTKEFSEFKSPTFRNADGLGNTYGLTADGEGNGWWAEMNLDIVAKTDMETGKVAEIKIPPVAGARALLTAEEVKMYESAGSNWNAAMPWAEGPRRMGADKQNHVVWVCDWWGGNLAKIDTQTLKVTLIPLPHPDVQEPYQAAVDKEHNVWINLMNADEVIKYDPKTSKWTEYSFPTLGAETRYVSLLERDGKLEVILPYSRARRVARMSFRTKQDLQALKEQAQQQEQARAQ